MTHASFQLRKISIVAALCGLSMGLADVAVAQQSQEAARPQVNEGIAAVVNDSVISTYDLQQRMRLLIISAGGRVPPEAMPQIQSQALDALIEERLKIQEAAEYELQISDEELRQEIESVASGNGLTADQLLQQLQQQGVSPQTFYDQIRADTAWQTLVQGRFGRKVRVTNDQIDEVLDRMTREAQTEQYLVSEIFLPVDNPNRAEEMYNGGLQLIQQMGQGAPFGAVARQFSAAPSAAVGGDIGWVQTGELAEELNRALSSMQPGQISAPIPSEGGFYIMALRDKRDLSVAAANRDDRLRLVQAMTSMDRGEDVAAQRLAAVAAAGDCASALGAAGGDAAVTAIDIGEMGEGEVAPAFRNALEGLKNGEATAPIQIGGAMHMLVLCNRNMGGLLPSRQAIENRLYGQQLNMFARRYLRDLRRDSAIEVRIADG
ncbi:MAG: peptidylprolyl isomerase [Pseudomonadota bacterium]